MKKSDSQENRIFKRAIVIFIIAFIIAVAGDITQKNSDGIFSSFSIKEATLENGRELILVNSDYSVPDDFEVDLIALSNGEQIDREAYEYLQDMFDDMRAEGYYPLVVSGYRSEEEQEEIFESRYASYRQDGYSKKEAKSLTESWVAEPGTSEHQLGLAADINPDREKSSDEVYEWLEDNSYKYGFIKRYPADKTEITGISNEPWHYRFVGEEVAEEMYKMNLCLEEYIEYIS